MARLFITALEAMGHRVEVISRLRSHNSDGDAGNEARTAAEAGEEVDRLTRIWSHDAARRPDLLFTYHVYHKAADYIAPPLKERFSVPYIIAEPSVAPKRQNGPWAAGYLQAGKAIRAADALLAITELDRVCLADFAGEEKTLLFPPFLDPTPYVAAAAARDDHRRRVAERFRIKPDRQWLLAVGMMRGGDKLASYRCLADAISLVPDLQAELIVVGDGPERGTVESAFAGLNVCFTGQLEADEVTGVYAASDLYVWPAVNEAYGLALLEAQAAGLPVLSVRTRGVPDIVQHGETGWLVADHSPDTIARGLRSILPDKHRLASMASNAMQRVVRQLSMHAAQRRLAAVFDRLGLPQ